MSTRWRRHLKLVPCDYRFLPDPRLRRRRVRRCDARGVHTTGSSMRHRCPDRPTDRQADRQGARDMDNNPGTLADWEQKDELANDRDPTDQGRLRAGQPQRSHAPMQPASRSRGLVVLQMARSTADAPRESPTMSRQGREEGLRRYRRPLRFLLARRPARRRLDDDRRRRHAAQVTLAPLAAWV